jgi:hypothetical protein
MRIDLSVPYTQKDTAKSCGARWDAHKRVWYFTDEARWKLFTRWMTPEDIRLCVLLDEKLGSNNAGAGKPQGLPNTAYVRGKKTTHLWNGTDTYCRMWSTGGLKKSKYQFSDVRGDNVCHLCLSVSRKKPRLSVVSNEIEREKLMHIRSIVGER